MDCNIEYNLKRNWNQRRRIICSRIGVIWQQRRTWKWNRQTLKSLYWWVASFSWFNVGATSEFRGKYLDDDCCYTAQKRICVRERKERKKKRIPFWSGKKELMELADGSLRCSLTHFILHSSSLFPISFSVVFRQLFVKMNFICKISVIMIIMYIPADSPYMLDSARCLYLYMCAQRM